MSITRIEPGLRLSQAVVHGNTVYLAGQVGRTSAPSTR
jgi:enamine deaminase RidA (YjgF/YER057c/UK114 family)